MAAKRGRKQGGGELLELAQAARALGIEKRALRAAVDDGRVPAGRGLRLEREIVDRLAKDPPPCLVAVQAARASRRPVRLGPDVRVSVPARRTPPETVVAHLGPTNSGKTHDALAFLAERGRGVYAAPLRMLAQEAHQRLSARLGADRVGLLTGEERVEETAPILCCTAEMAPMAGDTLVLDEVHWAADRERGSAWTTLLVGAEYRHVRLIGALDALPLVERAFPEAEVVVHERKGLLSWVGELDIARLEPGTVVVAFSRRAVLGLAGELNRHRPGKVGALYGAMPVPSRRKEIERFIAGEAEVIAATDVLGHGVNLPCETIVFAETDKFDGDVRRALEPWELAQIAGRAGRFGHHEVGKVGILGGLAWATPKGPLVESALAPHVPLPGGLLGYRRVKNGRLGPRLSDLGVERADDLDRALLAWEELARREFAGASWLRSSRSSRSSSASSRCGSRSDGAGTSRSTSTTPGPSRRRRSTRRSTARCCRRWRSPSTATSSRRARSRPSSTSRASSRSTSPRPRRPAGAPPRCAGSRSASRASPA
ncbi:MAG: helicase-related protein [Thermoleophilia bacterium]